MNRRISIILLLTICMVILSGCTAYKSKLSGKYVDNMGNYLIFQNDGMVEVALPKLLPDETASGTYEITTKWVLLVFPEKTLYINYLSEDGIEQFFSAKFKFKKDNIISINNTEFRQASFDDSGNIDKSFKMPWWGWAIIIFVGLGIIGAIGGGGGSDKKSGESGDNATE